jgi:hypothetical protein
MKTFNRLMKNLKKIWILKRYGKYKIMVRGLNAVQWFSFKNFDAANLNVEDDGARIL